MAAASLRDKLAALCTRLRPHVKVLYGYLNFPEWHDVARSIMFHVASRRPAAVMSQFDYYGAGM
jgi:hypothetical protein